MRFPRLLSSLFLMAACCAISCSAKAAPGDGGAQPPAPRVAIANPSRIFNEMQETKALREKLEQKRVELEAQERQKHADIKDMVDKRATINPNNQQFRAATANIDIAMANLQAWQASTRKQVERDQKWMVKGLYDKIEAAIGEVAIQNNIDLVIADGRQDIPNLEEVPAEELRRMLNGRNVLYANKGIDLSERVITLLDAKYAQDKK